MGQEPEGRRRRRGDCRSRAKTNDAVCTNRVRGSAGCFDAAPGGDAQQMLRHRLAIRGRHAHLPGWKTPAAPSGFPCFSPKDFRVIRKRTLALQGRSSYTWLPRLQLGRAAPSMFFNKLLKSLLSKAKRGLREIWMVGFIFAQIKLKVNVNSYVSLYDCLSVHSFIKLKSCMEGH
jgi:hypothetical protein